MADLGQTFNADQLPEGDDKFDPIPPGWYTATIKEAESKETKSGNNGRYLSIRFDVVGPTHAGRVVYTNINYRNPNPKAEQIGLQQLGDIMRAIGLPNLTDSDQLIGNTLQIKAAIDKDDAYGARNIVKGFKAVDGSAAPKLPSAQASSGSSQNAAASPPWAKK